MRISTPTWCSFLRQCYDRKLILLRTLTRRPRNRSRRFNGISRMFHCVTARNPERSHVAATAPDKIALGLPSRRYSGCEHVTDPPAIYPQRIADRFAGEPAFMNVQTGAQVFIVK